ncbi:class I SAM-dependent methyltransferase [Algoriphagus halophytocola]|uniref:Class I SAM-dependent methyltransferase n=1 Tax=Algoriphagus halophytocola TaxID=2991499 RepID=A0ABY6MLT9_9BACT|nr:class I SAM-dependent methyltransferase [Algoriphagus sp. TR-M5]UZD23939.1 class I SAM-dependent methyltransferase [Algoriphagus sp. TR-M5]
MNRLDVINYLLKKNNGKSYLEIGIRNGNTIAAVKCSKKTGVDPAFRFGRRRELKLVFYLERFKAFRQTSDDFFNIYAEKRFQKGIDVAFIDGLHTYSQSYKDIINSLKYLNEDGYIVVHDCNPISFAHAYPAKTTFEEVKKLGKNGKIPGWTGQWNGDVWKSILRLRLERNDLQIITLDCDHGLGIIKKLNDITHEELKIDVSLTEIENLSYDFFDKNRKYILNLKEPTVIYDF